MQCCETWHIIHRQTYLLAHRGKKDTLIRMMQDWTLGGFLELWFQSSETSTQPIQIMKSGVMQLVRERLEHSGKFQLQWPPPLQEEQVVIKEFTPIVIACAFWGQLLERHHSERQL